MEQFKAKQEINAFAILEEPKKEPTEKNLKKKNIYI